MANHMRQHLWLVVCFLSAASVVVAVDTVGKVVDLNGCGYTVSSPCTIATATVADPTIRKGSPPPAGYELLGPPTPSQLNCVALKFLGSVYGETSFFTLNGRQLAARIDYHFDNHPDPKRPPFWHPGVSIYQIKGNAPLPQCVAGAATAPTGGTAGGGGHASPGGSTTTSGTASATASGGKVVDLSSCGIGPCSKAYPTITDPAYKKGSPPPAGYEPIKAPIPRNLNCLAKKFLTPHYGEFSKFVVDGRQLAARVEYHFDNHPKGGGPPFWHVGVTIYQIKGNAKADCAALK